MSQCKPKIIIEGANFNISRCETCDRIGLYYKNILLGFERIDFDCFAESFTQIDFEHFSQTFPDEQHHIVINSAHPDIQFTFTKDEFLEFKDVIHQVQLVLEADAILKGYSS